MTARGRPRCAGVAGPAPLCAVSPVNNGYVPIDQMEPDTVGLPGPRGEEVIRVTDTHTDGDRVTWTFTTDLGAVHTARCAVRDQLGVWQLDTVSDLAALLVSELVTNALRHATGPVGVCLTRPSVRSGVLLVEVSDPLPDPRANARPAPTTRAGEDCSSWPSPRAAGVTGRDRAGRRCGSNSRSRGEVSHGRSRGMRVPVAPRDRFRSVTVVELGIRRRVRWLEDWKCSHGADRKASGPCCDREHRVVRRRSAGYCGQPPR